MSKRNLLKAAGAMLLAIAALAMLAPVLKSLPGARLRDIRNCRRQPGQTDRGALATIKPVSVTVDKFKKLAPAEAKKAASGIKESPRARATAHSGVEVCTSNDE